MIVLSIEEAGRGRFRCTAEDGRVFILTGRELAHTGAAVREGSAFLEEKAFGELMDYLYRKALGRCGNLLAGMDYPKRKLEEKLERDGYPRDIRERVIKELAGARYLDDSRYAANYVASGLSSKSLSRIRMELQEKGIDRDMIDEAAALAAKDTDIPGMERAQIRAFLTKKHYDPENCSFEEKQKLMAALFRRGYSAGLIRTELGSSEDGDGGM